MAEEPDYEDLMQNMNKHFGGRTQMLGQMIIELARTGQPCDITRYNHSPLLDVVIDPKITYALMYGAGPAKLKEMLDNVRLTNGDLVPFHDIWTIHPMPHDGITPDELAAVDLSEGDAAAGPNGETLRQMVRETYHCATPEEEEAMLRRFLAS